MITQDFSQRHIHRFNGIGGVDRLANISRKREEGNDAVPVVHPRLANRGILLVPPFRKLDQSLFCFWLSGSSINGLEMGGNCLTVFVGDIAEGVANQVNDTELYLGLGKDRLNRIRKIVPSVLPG
jgi:hypothetical protein